MTRQMTPSDIAAQVAALDGRLADLDAEAQRLALAATEGDADAAARLVAINAEMEAMRGDKFILMQACRAAEARAEVADEAEQARQRAAARDEAQGHVVRLLNAARRADAIVAELRAVAAEMADAEAAARDAARRAGGLLVDSRVGQRGAVAHAVGNITRTARGDVKVNTPVRPVADFVSAGWRHLIKETAHA